MKEELVLMQNVRPLPWRFWLSRLGLVVYIANMYPK